MFKHLLRKKYHVIASDNLKSKINLNGKFKSSNKNHSVIF